MEDKISNLVQAIIGIIASLGVITTFCGSMRSNRKERKRETVLFHSSIGDKCSGFLSAITKEFGDSGIIDYKEAKANKEIFKAIMGYLAAMEEFSVGINNDVFDLNIFKETAGPRSVIWYNRFEEIIYVIRKENNRPTIFKEFETMVNRIDPNRPKLNKQELQNKLDMQQQKEEQELQDHLQQPKKEIIEIQFNETPIDTSPVVPDKSEQAEPIKYTAEEQKSIDALRLEGINYFFTN